MRMRGQELFLLGVPSYALTPPRPVVTVPALSKETQSDHHNPQEYEGDLARQIGAVRPVLVEPVPTEERMHDGVVDDGENAERDECSTDR